LSSLPCSLSSYTCYPIYYHTFKGVTKGEE
jgi:hypothetical protein